MANSLNPSPVVYEAGNRILRTVQEYFAQRGRAVIQIQWQPGIDVGGRVAPGQLLARIVWDGLPDEDMLAPAGCAGTIAWIDKNICYELLQLVPLDLVGLAASV